MPVEVPVSGILRHNYWKCVTKTVTGGPVGLRDGNPVLLLDEFHPAVSRPPCVAAVGKGRYEGSDAIRLDSLGPHFELKPKRIDDGPGAVFGELTVVREASY